MWILTGYFHFYEITMACFEVSEVVQTLQLCTDQEQTDVVGDLSVCLDGMTVDPEMFATAEAAQHGESKLILKSVT